MPDPQWLPVLLGDVRVGDTVRTIPDKIPTNSLYKNVTGLIVGIRSGGITVQIENNWVTFWADQLERMDRPE